MISPGDRIMIGLSGGKDSLVMTAALAGLKRRSPVPFSLSACFVDVSGGAGDTEKLENFCRSLDIPFAVRAHPIEKIIKDRNERSPCSFCANIRRGILNTAALDEGCNLLALGHNLDDAAETALMNLFQTGRFKSFKPKLWQSRTGMTVIRPLVLAEERKIAREARRLGLPVMEYVCPFSLDTERVRAKKTLEMLGAANPAAKYNIIRALQRLDEDDRWEEPAG